MILLEWSRPVRLDEIGDVPRTIAIKADEAERRALARRFALLSLDRLTATAALRRDGARIFVEGRMEAAAVQACVATGDALPATLAETFALRFEPADPARVEETELDAGDLDVIPYEGGTIDLGEAVAETLSLALDPFPRAPDADGRLRDAGVTDEAAAGPFAALRALKP